MLMSPDSSINSSMSLTPILKASLSSTGPALKSEPMMMPSPSTTTVIRVQVQECSQSQPSVATAASAPFSHLAGHHRQQPIIMHHNHSSAPQPSHQQQQHPHHAHPYQTAPTSSSAQSTPNHGGHNHNNMHFLNKTLGNRAGPPSASVAAAAAAVVQHSPVHDHSAITMSPIVGSPMPSHVQHQQQPPAQRSPHGGPHAMHSIKQEFQPMHQQQQQHQQQPIPQPAPQQPQRPETPEYTKSFPVMDTTVASSVKGEPDLNIEFDGTTVLCRVCGDKASGFHYGVHSCEGCKGFFRRSIQQKIQYRPCTKNQQCSILRINRNRCQYCRLKKCIAVGMSRDAVRFGRVPKREKARILAAMQQSTQNRGHQRAMSTELDDQPRLLASVLRAHMETCEFTREKVTSMRHRARECPAYSMPTLACPLNPAPELQSEQEFSQRFAHVIRGVIDFAGMIPGFQLLTQDDKFTLLKAGLFDALFVRLICMFDSSMNSIICLNGQVMRRDAIQNGANARFLVDSTFNFSERMNAMNLSDAEIGLFCAIVLITPDRPGLRNLELIEKMYAKLKNCLQAVISQNRPNEPDFMGELLKLLPDLRTLSTLHTEKLVVFRTEHKELLRQQMWSLEDESRKSPGSNSWGCNDQLMEEVAKSPMGSVSSTESNDTASEYSTSLSASAPLLAATLSAGCPLRHRANSGSSADDDLVGTAHLTQNGLTITPVVRSVPTAHHIRYRKLDSPTDSGIESGNEKADHKTASSESSSCSSPRSSVEDITEDKRQIVEDMPVLKRVLQAPPLYDTNSLMDEAYKPHKKFRALRHRESDAEADSVQQSPQPHPVVSVQEPQQSQSPLHQHLTQTPQQPAPAQSQLHMHLTRPQHQQPSSLSSTHSVLARSLMEEPRMTPEQMKRSDIIQNYIKRESQAEQHYHQQQQQQQHHHHHLHQSHQPLHHHLGYKSPSGLLVCATTSTSAANSPAPMSSMTQQCPFTGRWSVNSAASSSSSSGLSVITTTPRHQLTPSPNASSSASSHEPPRYFQSPHSTSTSPPRPSPSNMSPRLIELQVDIADAQQPLNLSKKSPSPPPSATTSTSTSSAGASATNGNAHKVVMLEA